MAICGFRADNYPFGLLEGEGLLRIQSLLERLRAARFPADAYDEDSALLDALKGAGFLLCNEACPSLSPEGERFLETCRALIRSAGST